MRLSFETGHFLGRNSPPDFENLNKILDFKPSNLEIQIRLQILEALH